MKHSIRRRGAITAAAVAFIGPAAGTSNAAGSGSAATRTFSFIGPRNSKTVTLVNLNSLLINARCDAKGNPLVFAFTSAPAADLFGRLFDGLGRVLVIRNSAFTGQSRGVALSSSSGGFASTGTVLFETTTGKVVTVNYAFDNATTLAKRNVCTVYGSAIGS